MIECNCYAHRIQVEPVKDLHAVCVTFWYNGHSCTNVVERIKMAWKVLTHRPVEFEEIWFTADKSWQLAEELKQAAQEIENDETT